MITPAAWLTTCWATSNTAITMFQVLVTISTAAKVLMIHLKKMNVSKSCMLLRSIRSWMSSMHMTKVRIMPAMGTTTFSDRFRIMLKMLPFHA